MDQADRLGHVVRAIREILAPVALIPPILAVQAVQVFLVEAVVAEEGVAAAVAELAARGTTFTESGWERVARLVAELADSKNSCFQCLN